MATQEEETAVPVVAPATTTSSKKKQQPSHKFNKKEGYRFTLLSRSQQDPLLHDGGSEQVLHPLDRKTARAMESGAFKPADSMDYTSASRLAAAAAGADGSSNKRTKNAQGVSEVREVDEMGFRLDGYDYNQHLSSAAEGGTFIGVNGVEFSGRLQFDRATGGGGGVLPAEVFASEEQLPRRVDLEAILLAPELMDEDMKRQLEEEVEGVVVEEEGGAIVADWADDFMGQLLGTAPDDDFDDDEEGAGAGGAKKGKPMTSKMVQGFDFDAHMNRLMTQPGAERDEGDFEGSQGSYFDDEEEEEDEEDEFEEGEEEYEDADAHFAAVLAEYEEANAAEEYGETTMDDGADGAMAPHLAQDDPIVLRALAIYSQEQEDDTSLGEVGLPPSREEVLKFVRPETLLEEDVDITVPMEQPTVEGYMKAWGSYDLTERSRFDCETIVSTRSTSDNLPSVIALPQRAPKKQPMQAVREEEEEEEEMLSKMAARMQVAEKMEAEEEEEEEGEPVKSLLGDSTKRKRDETKEEKRARKGQLKAEKRDRRQEKKEARLVYKEEKKQVVSCLTARNAPLPGVSEFKI